MNYSRVALCVATHNRPEYLERCVANWLRTIPNLRALHVLVNHPDGARTFQPTLSTLDYNVIHTGRPPEHGGCMAQTWNTAFLWAFRDPDVDWCICSMDDASILPGWVEKLAARDADFYAAPAGDLVFVLNRRALAKVGWFDERFRAIGFQEWDYQARAILALGEDRVVIEDAHGWEYNPVGLSQHWQHIGGGAAPTTRNETILGYAGWWLQEKWGQGVPHGFIGMMASHSITPPKVPEIEWYPWFSRYCPE